MDYSHALKLLISGQVADDEATLTKYSRDASLFKVVPKCVVFPKSANDIGKIVSYVAEHKQEDPALSITARAAGSCMAGGSLNESIILDITKHMAGIKSWSENSAVVLPGTMYRDFEKESLARGLFLPCFPASKNLCAFGGMIGNNCAGEKTLRYGKMEKYVRKLKMVFADGVEREIKPLSRDELEAKKGQNDFEGKIYRKLDDLLTQNTDLIEKARPNVSKNSAGYYLWNIKQNGVFDLNKLIVGSQGTLGIVTEAEIGLVKPAVKSKMLVIFLKHLNSLGEIVNEILKENPETLESYDDNTLKFAIRFLPDLARAMRARNFIWMTISFIPEVLMSLRGGLPKLVMLAEFTGDNDEELKRKTQRMRQSLKKFHFAMRITHSILEEEKYLTIRRESFNLLRKHVRGKRTAPFIDDVVVRPEFLPEFLPKLRAILDKHKLLYTIAGHAGNGNFHVIPLMDMHDKRNKEIILPISKEVYSLVHQYGGSITAEHNDGIIRTPFLPMMYGEEVVKLFEKVKKIFDPQNIFNPGKKVNGSFEYLENHVAVE
ncbi:MAG TPA: FAD-binding oxidoreductase [Candidatus Paceibacterota bacterium]